MGTPVILSFISLKCLWFSIKLSIFSISLSILSNSVSPSLGDLETFGSSTGARSATFTVGFHNHKTFFVN